MSRGTPHRPIRISDELWARAQAKAALEGTTASEKVRRLLTEWVEEPTSNERRAEGQRMTITEFLEARIAEDESHAWSELGAEYFTDGAWPEECTKRVLAECAAKRAIIADHKEDWAGPVCTRCRFIGGYMEFPCPTIQALASVYADHPGYRQEWAL